MLKIKKYLDKEKQISLSDKQVLELVNNNANIILYRDLHNYNNIDEILYPYNACFLLYESKPNYGHWCCVTKHKNNIEFFDPYGLYIDEELNFIDDQFRIQSNQDYPYLTKLFYDSPYNLFYNEHQFQKFEDKMNTCGRWSALRILFKNIPLKQFAYLFQGNVSDYIATILTL